MLNTTDINTLVRDTQENTPENSQSSLEELFRREDRIASLKQSIQQFNAAYPHSDTEKQAQSLREETLVSIISLKKPVAGSSNKGYTKEEIKAYLMQASAESFPKLFLMYGKEFIKAYKPYSDLAIELLQSTLMSLRQEAFASNQKKLESLIQNLEHVPAEYREFIAFEDIREEDFPQYLKEQEEKIAFLETEKANRMNDEKIEKNAIQIQALQERIQSYGLDHVSFSSASDLSPKELIDEQEKYIKHLENKLAEFFERQRGEQQAIISELRSKINKLPPAENEIKPSFPLSNPIASEFLEALKEYTESLRKQYFIRLENKSKKLAHEILALERQLPGSRSEQPKEKEEESSLCSEEEMVRMLSEQEKYIQSLKAKLDAFLREHAKEVEEYHLWQVDITRLRNELAYFEKNKQGTPFFEERRELYVRMIATQEERYFSFRREHPNLVAVLDEKKQMPNPVMLKQWQAGFEREIHQDILKYKKLLDEQVILETRKSACFDRFAQVLTGKHAELDALDIGLMQNIKEQNGLEEKYPRLPIRYYAQMLEMITAPQNTEKNVKEAPHKIYKDDEYFCLEQQCNGRLILIPERMQQVSTENRVKADRILDEVKRLPDVSYQDGDVHFKILLLGNTSIGKSCLLLRTTDDTYTEAYISTIGVNFKAIRCEYQGRKIYTQLWDSIGQERFGMQGAFCRNPNILFLCFDLTDRKSFQDVIRHFNDRKSSESITTVILVGNKCDLEHEREISSEEARAFALQQGWAYFETSAKESIHCQELLVYSLASHFNHLKKEGKLVERTPPQASNNNNSFLRGSSGASSSSSSSSRPSFLSRIFN